MNAKFRNKPKLQIKTKFLKPQITNEAQISKETPLANKPQILREHQISKVTQIMNDPKF